MARMAFPVVINTYLIYLGLKNGYHFADDLFKLIFFNENIYILIQISLNFVPRHPIDNNFEIIENNWCLLGTTTLPEPMMIMMPIS